MKRIIALTLSLVFVFLFAGCGGELAEYRPITDVNDFDGRRIGCIVGWESDYLLTGRTDLTLRRYDSTADMLMALAYKQLDGIAVDEETSRLVFASMEGISMVEEPIAYIGYTLMASDHGKKYMDEFDEWLVEFMKTDEYKEYDERNHSFDGENFIKLDIEEASNPTEELNVGFIDIYYPCAFEDSTGYITGFDIDIVRYFARDMGYKLNFYLSSEAGVGEMIYNNKIDFYAGGTTEVYRDEYTSVDGIYMSQAFRKSYIRVIEVSDWDNLRMTGIIDD